LALSVRTAITFRRDEKIDYIKEGHHTVFVTAYDFPKVNFTCLRMPRIRKTFLPSNLR
jgi:hypothetical protein